MLPIYQGSRQAMHLDISVVYFRKEKEISGKVDSYFVASRNPFYIGIIMKPSSGVWEILKSSSTANLRVEGKNICEYEIPYKIEVGENTIFFLKPAEGNEKESADIFLSSKE